MDDEFDKPYSGITTVTSSFQHQEDTVENIEQRLELIIEQLKLTQEVIEETKNKFVRPVKQRLERGPLPLKVWAMRFKKIEELLSELKELEDALDKIK